MSKYAPEADIVSVQVLENETQKAYSDSLLKGLRGCSQCGCTANADFGSIYNKDYRDAVANKSTPQSQVGSHNYVKNPIA